MKKSIARQILLVIALCVALCVPCVLCGGGPLRPLANLCDLRSRKLSGKIKVNVIGSAATVLPQRCYEFDVQPGMTLRAVLVLLSREGGPGFGEKVYDRETGKMNEYVTVFVNSREARSLRGTDTILEPGDVVTIMPPMAGGFGKAMPRGFVQKVDALDDRRFKS